MITQFKTILMLASKTFCTDRIYTQTNICEKENKVFNVCIQSFHLFHTYFANKCAIHTRGFRFVKIKHLIDFVYKIIYKVLLLLFYYLCVYRWKNFDFFNTYLPLALLIRFDDNELVCNFRMILFLRMEFKLY